MIRVGAHSNSKPPQIEHSLFVVGHMGLRKIAGQTAFKKQVVNLKADKTCPFAAHAQ